MNELTVRNSSYDETEKVAVAMYKSGYFADTRDASQAIVKIMAGREMGFGAFASMTGVYIIQGRPSVGANLMASAVKRSGRYDYKVIELTDSACEIEYYQGGKTIGRSRFTIEDARKAGTKNLDKFPRNMLFARAMSNGVRWYTPDVFDGAAVYTPEELGAEVNEAGDVIDIKVTKPVEIIPQAEAAPVVQHPAVDWVDNLPIDLLEELRTEHKANHANQIKNALKMSCLTADTPHDEIRGWMRTYRSARTAGSTPQEAAEHTNGEWIK